MNVSSGGARKRLGDIETKQVGWLMSVLAQCSLRQRSYIESSYNEQARNFNDTARFLKALKWIRERQGRLSLTRGGHNVWRHSQSEGEMKKRILDAVFANTSPYQGMLFDYLIQFRPVGSHLVHHPSTSQRLKEGRVRNLLMDIGLVTYRRAGDLYLLVEAGIELYLCAKTSRLPTSRKKIEKSRQRKEAIGYRAEIAALEYEWERLGGEWANEVEHVSAKSPFACYDVKSVTLQDGRPIPRYIEVKAEPAGLHQFFWTASEIGAARLLRAKYFLYLLPVTTRGGFDTKKMAIVQDPYMSVYRNPQRWIIEENVIVCRQRQ